MNIAIVGTGYVGLVSGTCFAEMGVHVTCVDVNKEKINALVGGQIPIYEPGLDEMVLRNHREGRLNFTTDLVSVLDNVDVVFCAVGTPPDEDGSADLQYVLAVARQFGQKIKKYTVLVTKSTKNYELKKKLFTSMENLTIVPVSQWLGMIVKKSFLKNYPINVIQNGIDLKLFSPQSLQSVCAMRNKLGLAEQTSVLLGVASIWDKRKGLEDFVQLYNMISEDWVIVLVGLSKTQLKEIPDGIIGIERTENVTQLATLYTLASVFINPTWEDTFPTTNLESLACGTPVITYRTGGSVESVSDETGYIVEKGDIKGIKRAVAEIVKRGKEVYHHICRKRAVKYYDKNERFEDYIKLYDTLLK